MQFPPTLNLLKDYDVLALVHDPSSLTRQRLPTYFDGGITVALCLDRFQLRRLDPHIHDTLPKCLDSLPAAHHITLRWE